MGRIYRDYISIDDNFIPVFNKYWDKEQPEKWKSFFPHDSFKSILKLLTETLEMSAAQKNMPLWMSGAYGTGKTYASFVIKHILEDNLDEIKPYFDTNNMTTLFNVLSGIRNKGKILVVHRSGSSSIVGDNRLYNCIRESIKTALKENGFTYFGAKSQFDVVLDTLKDENASFNFANAFKKYKAKFTEYSSPKSVIKDLEELQLEETIDLLETIVEVAELENYVWSTTHDEVVNWIDDVVKGNNLYSIVFIWDEFTEYFKKNQNQITGLQELAHAAANIKFYFFLITHSTASQLIADSYSRKIIEARFKLPQIEMADTTAFMLMGQALKHNKSLQNEWDNEIIDLWQRVERCTKDSILRYADDIKESELKMLLPLHPYAAYLLKVISSSISSNQRTMFSFLSGDSMEGGVVKTNFRWFIENHSNEINKWNYLTANYIWDYFFTLENVDLDEASKGIISHYSTFENQCGGIEDKKKVLKVALLLTAMQQRTGGGRSRGLSSLLRPTLTNISACFIGTPISSSVHQIMTEFCQKGVFGEMKEGNEVLYVTQSRSINKERFDNIKEEIAKAISFEKLLTNTEYGVYERFIPNDFLKHRYIIAPITPNDYKNAAIRLMQEKVNKIPLFFMFTKNEVDKSKVNSVIEKIYAEFNRDVVVVDFSNQIFTDTAYESFINLKAEERYFVSEDTNRSNLCKRNAKILIDEWKNKLDVTSLIVYSEKDKTDQCQGGASLRSKFKEINHSIFSCGLEKITINDKVFEPQGFKEPVAAMGMSKVPVPPNNSWLNSISTKLIQEHIWNTQDYTESNPSHPVSKMKLAIEEIIKNGFEQKSKVEIVEIWRCLEKKPFGLLCCAGSTYLLGFLLTEYADNVYYKSDEVNTVNLNYTDLSDLIFGVVKDNPKARGQYIVKQTPEHVEFCKITGSIFKIAGDKQNSIADVAKNIKIFLSNNEYPLWSLVNYIEETEEKDIKDVAIKAVSLFCEFISSAKMTGRDETKIAEELYLLYKREAGLDKYLELIMQVQNMKEGMQFYIGAYKPELISLAKKLGIKGEDYIVSLNSKITRDASYIWQKNDIDRQIDNVYEEYLLIDTINKVLNEKKNNILDASIAVADKISIIKLPHSMLIEALPELDSIIKCLISIKNRIIESRVDIIKEINLNADIFNGFFDKQFSTFTKVMQEKLGGSITTDELEHVYNNITSNVFTMKTDMFIQFVNQELDKYRKSRKINQLQIKWREITGSNNPITWSKENAIPILCLFVNDIIKAQDAFELINKTRVAKSELDIDEALAYVNGGKLSILADQNKCNEIFRTFFAGVYDPIIEDVAELQSIITNNFGDNAYDWFAKKAVIETTIEKLANKKYEQEYRERAKAKIKELSPESAKRILEKWIEDKPLIGIDILKYHK
jgi:hypothetical protein